MSILCHFFIRFLTCSPIVIFYSKLILCYKRSENPTRLTNERLLENDDNGHQCKYVLRSSCDRTSKLIIC